MSHKDREVIDEQEVIDNLFDENGQKLQQNHHQVIYKKHRSCFDIRSVLINLVIYTLVLMVTSGLFEGFYINGLNAALYTAMVMTVLNIVLKPILVFVTLPLTIVTFGGFYLIVNAMILWIADGIVGDAFEITSFFTAIVASIFISILRMAINHYVLKDEGFKINL